MIANQRERQIDKQTVKMRLKCSLNIVEDSYINGQLSRVLSTIPIRMKKEWSFHQFNNLNFVPIKVKEFSRKTLKF